MTFSFTINRKQCFVKKYSKIKSKSESKYFKYIKCNLIANIKIKILKEKTYKNNILQNETWILWLWSSG